MVGVEVLGRVGAGKEWQSGDNSQWTLVARLRVRS